MTKAIESWIERNKTKFQNETEKNHLVDFLMSEYSHKGSINFTYETCLSKCDAWMNNLHQKASKLKTAGQFKTVQTFPDGYHVVQLLDSQATLWEGNVMGHCVGSKNYRPETIFSLRDPQGLPHATIRVEQGIAQEIQGKGNKAVKGKYITKIASFIEDNKLEITHLQGFVNIHKDSINALETVFTNITKIKSKDGFLVQKDTLREKGSADLEKLEMEDLLDVHTTPSFFKAILKNKGKKEFVSSGAWHHSFIHPTEEGMGYVFESDPAFALELYNHYSDVLTFCWDQLLKFGHKEVLLKSMKKHPARGLSVWYYSLTKLIERKDYDVNSLIFEQLCDDSIHFSAPAWKMIVKKEFQEEFKKHSHKFSGKNADILKTLCLPLPEVVQNL